MKPGNGTLASTSVSYIVCALPATNNLFAPEMAKNSPSATRTSTMAYCSKMLLPSSANWANRFQSTACPSIGGCAVTIAHIIQFGFSGDGVNQDLAVSGVDLCS